MATETAIPLTSAALALFVADPHTGEDEVERVVARLPAEQVPLLVARATPIRRLLETVETMGEGRISAERIIDFGGEWIDPETGEIFAFSGDPGEYEVNDPEGLRAALRATHKVSQVEIDIAVRPTYKLDNVQLNLLARRADEVREVIEDFRSRKPWRPAHLRPKER